MGVCSRRGIFGRGVYKGLLVVDHILVESFQLINYISHAVDIGYMILSIYERCIV